MVRSVKTNYQELLKLVVNVSDSLSCSSIQDVVFGNAAYGDYRVVTVIISDGCHYT